MYLNRATLIGNLTRDPEMKQLPSGTSVTTFGLATNRIYNDKEGNRQEQTDFHNIVVFGRTAETVAQYLKKGSMALIEGRIQTRSWDDKETGQKRYRTEVVADRVQFGPKNASSGGGNSAPAQSKGGEEKLDTIEYPEDDINPDDIPF